MKKRTLTKAQAAVLTGVVAMASPLAFADNQPNPTALQNPLVVASACNPCNPCAVENPCNPCAAS